MLRDLVAHLHTELARRYAGKPQPAVDRELEAADQAIALWQALWEQYSACLKPLLEGDPELAGVKAKLLQRGLYVGKQLVLVHGLARRVPPPALWQELHAYYRLAEMLECAVTAVSDDLMPNAIGISCYSTYSHALLLGLADPCAMSVKQIELTDRWLAMWARKIFPVRAAARDRRPGASLIDLDAARARRSRPRRRAQPAASMRFGYPGKLATSVRGRLKRLQTGANPAELQLGHDCSVEQCTTLLGHLDARWYQVPRREHDVAAKPRSSSAAAASPAAYFRVGGRTFDRKDPLGRLSFQGAQHLQTLGAAHRLRPRPRRRRAHVGVGALGRPLRLARGEPRARVAGARIAGRSTSSPPCATRSACASGIVTRVAQDAHGELALSLRLWPGSAEGDRAAAALDGDSRGRADAGAAARRNAGRQGQCLLLPSRTFNPSRVLRSIDAGPERRFRLTRLLQRGADFERVAFEETTWLHGDAPPASTSARPAAPRTMPNRLAGETSPYLLQHAGNPVDWHPWDETALVARAPRRQADPAVRRLFGVSLVPRDGARIVRGSRTSRR